MAEVAHANGAVELPDPYWRHAKTRERLGYPAFLAMLPVYFLMMLKPM